MKRKITILLEIIGVGLILCSCNNTAKKPVEEQSFIDDTQVEWCPTIEDSIYEVLIKRANEVCKHLPCYDFTTEPLSSSKEYMTEDFYSIIETLYNSPTPIDITMAEWQNYFNTKNGGPISIFEVPIVTMVDSTHAIASIRVRPTWIDGTYDEDDEWENHSLYLEWDGDNWLMSDFDGRKIYCAMQITRYWLEQIMRDTIIDYLAKEIGPQYYNQPDEICIPEVVIIDVQYLDDSFVRILCDSRIYWYQIKGDTLFSCCGGYNAGRIMLRIQGNDDEVADIKVKSFKQVDKDDESSAKRIFGEHYTLYQQQHNNSWLWDKILEEQARKYVQRNNIPVRYLKFQGLNVVDLSKEE